MSLKKIKIDKISKKVFIQKGFSSGAFGGCLNCPCGKDKKGGTCCRSGCDVDRESYKLILKNRKAVEDAIKARIEDCLVGKWIVSKYYLGGSYRRSKIREDDGYCIFHSLNKKGCELVKLVIERKIPRRIIPMICRLYPLSWENGELFVYDEKYAPIEDGCDCTNTSVHNTANQTIIESQKDELKDVFKFVGRAAGKIM